MTVNKRYWNVWLTVRGQRVYEGAVGHYPEEGDTLYPGDSACVLSVEEVA